MSRHTIKIIHWNNLDRTTLEIDNIRLDITEKKAEEFLRNYPYTTRKTSGFVSMMIIEL